MARRASRKPASARLKVVGQIGTDATVLSLLSDATARAQNDETLAVAIVEVGREGMILHHYCGHETGFLHQLVAGAKYLMDDLCND
jgi:hypothetical protein